MLHSGFCLIRNARRGSGSSVSLDRLPFLLDLGMDRRVEITPEFADFLVQLRRLVLATNSTFGTDKG